MDETTKADLSAHGAKTNTRKEALKFFWVHPGFWTVCLYRLYARLYPGKGIKRIIARLLWLRVTRKTSCYISPLAQIGAGLELRHPAAIVIGDGVKIGRNVSIYQNVTLGQRGSKTTKSYPTIDDGVTIYAGACILGNIHIGKNAVIGANAVVLDDVPADSVSVGIPARILTPAEKQKRGENSA